MSTCTPFNVFIGSESGLLKGANVEKKSWANLNDFQQAKRDNEISILYWADESQQELCVGLRNGVVNVFDVDSQTFTKSHRLIEGSGPLRGLAKWQDSFITCTEKGVLKVWAEENEVGEQVKLDLTVGDNVRRMRQNAEQRHLVATGGKENDLKIWDLQNPSQPVFKAKNVKNDWLNLRVPVWVMDMAFVPGGQKVVTCTGHHQVRVYDPSTPQKRPVVDMEFNEHPLTCLSLRPNGYEVMVGNTQGTMALMDIRGKGHMVQKYKGFAGAIRCLECHSASDVVASCGLDRFLRIHDINSKLLLHKIYLKSRLNCLLLSDHWTEEKTEVPSSRVRTKQRDGHAKEPTEAAEDEEEEEEEEGDVWQSLPVVRTKKLKKKRKSEFKEDMFDFGTSGRVPVISAAGDRDEEDEDEDEELREEEEEEVSPKKKKRTGSKSEKNEARKTMKKKKRKAAGT